MMMTALLRPATLATFVAVTSTVGAGAQTTAVDPNHPNPTLAQAMPPSGIQGMPRQGGQPGQWGMMPGMGPDMMGQGIMSQGMMNHSAGMMSPDMMGPGAMSGMAMMAMRGQMMKIMFAIADANGDGGLSFDEVTAIHKRIFDRVDANKDGKVVLEEVQAFMTP
ncbi:EF-hand domain-containing protein [Rhizobium sp. 3T7]|uniref:EF-hand domain-containing protein n=1 Tax=Rhizobium sp. 3T7 TaxID=2874922 RepID=UPI001CCC4ED9|nr:EF-hand domain-containing protein [Rhizobium sp. 3T7]MBZ9791062.1 EF-hand domain-containing protein [Rhizobium sp. 3T7]